MDNKQKIDIKLLLRIQKELNTPKYKVYCYNAIEYGIELTNEKVGDYEENGFSYEVFKNFTDAKNRLISLLQSKKRDFDIAIKFTRQTLKSDIQ